MSDVGDAEEIDEDLGPDPDDDDFETEDEIDETETTESESETESEAETEGEIPGAAGGEAAEVTEPAEIPKSDEVDLKKLYWRS